MLWVKLSGFSLAQLQPFELFNIFIIWTVVTFKEIGSVYGTVLIKTKTVFLVHQLKGKRSHAGQLKAKFMTASKLMSLK